MALKGIKVVEFAGLAPGPFAGLVLADNGATVFRIDKPFQSSSSDILCRNKRSLAINPKIPSGLDVLKKVVASSDVLIDPFRPGVMERLGLGPVVFLGENGKVGLNEKLIYARIVGFPRTGSHKDMAGHDINYLALSGILSMLPGSHNRPTFPLNLLADFAGGGLLCTLGIILALFERNSSGRGQVVNVDMVSGARYVSSFPLMHFLNPSTGTFAAKRGGNLLDGGAPFYNIYTCKDGAFMSVGCLEPQFFNTFIEHFIKALPSDFKQRYGWVPNSSTQFDRNTWPELKNFLELGFHTRTRDEWTAVFMDTDACAVPILTPEEASQMEESGQSVPLPHPRILSKMNGAAQVIDLVPIELPPGKHTEEILQELGLTDTEYQRLVQDGAIEGTRSKL
ncbi:CoA-transferase family III domain-containing protein [Lentinula aciculospora]|uniref:CoA-transferase family III domain-containing protein n=1 Tax=Lentinula aciculospora TaxID=153920 RepID=A0A9W9A8I8_9AGAR|nr:CoA-transferase family III domain-containing protein [Lentinula aciculospora]